jgi:2-(1,2-epoxy-1,2-dihydrophenyl)acetyl-CoA isomerase
VTDPDLLSDGVVRHELHDGVAHVQLNRPNDANGMNLELLEGLHRAIVRCHADDRVEAVLLSGAGKNFCAGGDVPEFDSRGEDLSAYLRETTYHLAAAVNGLISLPVPVVTVVQGFAAGGGGFGLVCASDIVIAADSARFFTGATRVGMVPDAGTTVTLTQIVGLRRAMELVLTNRQVSAQEALDIGLVTRLAPAETLLEDGWALARSLAEGPTHSLGAAKRLLWEGVGASVEARLAAEAAAVARLGAAPDGREGLAAVIARRDPSFARGR